jgi:ERCC4-type nuclease
MTIVMDSREPDTLQHLMRRKGLNFRVKKLPAFDYIINDKIGIERKCWPDLVGSVVDRRLHKQLDNMIGSKYRPFILLEGAHIDTAYRIRKYSPNLKGDARDIAQSAMITIAINYGIPIIHSYSQYDTIDIIAKIEKKDNKPYVARYPKPMKKLSNAAKVLSIIDGVGANTALNIANQCGKNFNKYNKEDLMKVKGVGSKTADKIITFLGDIIG